MGVSASLKAIHSDDLEKLIGNNSLLIPFLFGPEADSVSARDGDSLLSRLFRRKEVSRAVSFHETPMVSLAGHWGIVTFALCGPTPLENDPLDLVEGDFADITTIDLGYGPPRLILNSSLRQFRDALRLLDDDKISARLNEADLAEAEIYEREEILSNLPEWRTALLSKVAELRKLADYCVKNDAAALVYFH